MAGEAGAAPLRVLVVEDEPLVAMLLEDILIDDGHEVVRVVHDLDDAMAFVAASADAFDFAILDVNLGGRPIFPVADALADRGKPFAFATGYGPGGLPEAWRGRPTLAKPFGATDVARTLGKMRG